MSTSSLFLFSVVIDVPRWIYIYNIYVIIFSSKVCFCIWILTGEERRCVQSIFSHYTVCNSRVCVASSMKSRGDHELSDSENSHIVPLFSLILSTRWSITCLQRPSVLAPDHRGCSCLFIVHHHCLHGSDDAPESIVALEQTSEQQTVEAGESDNYHWRTEWKYKVGVKGGRGVGGYWCWWDHYQRINGSLAGYYKILR